MPVILRDVRERDLDAVLALNNNAGPSIIPIDSARVRFFYEHAAYFRVAEIDGGLAGFLIALTEDAPYQSCNFLWYRERYEHFCYIDRIVIASSHRGAGLGRVFYADVQNFAEVRTPYLACEVFLQPGNDVAMLFHGIFGFAEVGQQVMPESGQRVSLLAKPLCSWPWVRDTYLAGGNGRLPELPWLAGRRLPAERPSLATGT